MKSRVIIVILDHPGNGEPVDMDIPGGHKDGDLDAIIFEIFRFIGFFNHNDFTVGRATDDIFASVKFTFWGTEKTDDHYKKPKPDSIKPDMEPGLTGKDVVKCKQHYSDKQKGNENCSVSFSMD